MQPGLHKRQNPGHGRGEVTCAVCVCFDWPERIDNFGVGATSHAVENHCTVRTAHGIASLFHIV